MGNGNQIAVRDNTALMPQTLDEKLKLAEVLAKSGLVPTSLNSKEKVYVALQMGHELGLSPMVSVNNVAVINGRPTLSADVMYALGRSNPEYGGLVWKQRDAVKAEVEVTRITGKVTEKFTGYFTMEMAKAAGLAEKDIYKKYPDRMLRARAISRAFKEAFPDVFAGIYSSEEAEDIDIEVMRNVTPDAPEHKGTGAEDLAAELAKQAETEPTPQPAGAVIKDDDLF